MVKVCSWWGESGPQSVYVGSTIADRGPLLSRRREVKGSRTTADGRDVPASSSAPASTTVPGSTGAAATKDVTKYHGTTTQTPGPSFGERLQNFGTDWQGFASLLF